MKLGDLVVMIILFIVGVALALLVGIFAITVLLIIVLLVIMVLRPMYAKYLLPITFGLLVGLVIALWPAFLIARGMI